MRFSGCFLSPRTWFLKFYTSHGCWFQSVVSFTTFFICSRFLDGLSQALDSYLPKMSGFELLKTVYHLCQLGHFPSAPLQQLLQSGTLEQFKTTGKSRLFPASCFLYSICFIWTASVFLQRPGFSLTKRECFKQWTCAFVSTTLHSPRPRLSLRFSWETPSPAVHQPNCGSRRACRLCWRTRRTQRCRKRCWWRTPTS